MSYWTWNVFLTYDEVIWSVRGSPAKSCTLLIAEMHLNRHEWLDLWWMLKNQGEIINSKQLCTLAGSWHELEKKIIVQHLKIIETWHLQTLLRKAEKQAMPKIRPLSQACNMLIINCLGGGASPRCGRGQEWRRLKHIHNTCWYSRFLCYYYYEINSSSKGSVFFNVPWCWHRRCWPPMTVRAVSIGWYAHARKQHAMSQMVTTFHIQRPYAYDGTLHTYLVNRHEKSLTSGILILEKWNEQYPFSQELEHTNEATPIYGNK